MAARRFAERNPGSHSAAGAAAHATGVHDGDLARIQQAVAEFRLANRPLALAAALEDAASIGGSGYEEALSIVTACGAERVRARIEAVLRARGTVAPEPPAPAAPCLPQLSPAERRVAIEVGRGCTNIEVAEILFISKHTVDAHLRNIFSKLGVRRRAELAAVVARECGPTT
ncbi:hypothetical protein Ato02nite_082980 [Paractinoplanes toevensis]|uniref:HTH luxR-type domain-containing protein n=1 Tax=Paractinoplanes toevensis TaxID=571911 RepID=A0A919WAC7_9ACTN|nr:hypothetical protein Ato02nite_082980 [Actinoplanes toevensis]